MRFVVHEHQASHHHFDFRLEIAGVLKSWAIPKGPSLNPVERRLAIQVPDHPLEYGNWEGMIPPGDYGAGAVAIWDEGECRLSGGGSAEEQWEKGSVSLELEGKILRGAFSLVKMRGPDREKEWLLIKKKDAFSQPDWKIETVLTRKKLSNLRAAKPPCQME
jgi:bifunctional non-homologous end joining protein LigD